MTARRSEGPKILQRIVHSDRRYAESNRRTKDSVDPGIRGQNMQYSKMGRGRSASRRCVADKALGQACRHLLRSLPVLRALASVAKRYCQKLKRGNIDEQRDEEDDNKNTAKSYEALLAVELFGALGV